MKFHDDMWKELASKYADEDGARLKAEAEKLDLEGCRLPDQEMDRRLMERIRRQPKSNVIKLLWSLAACVVIFLLSSPILNRSMTNQSKAPEAVYEEESGGAEAVSFSLPSGYEISTTTVDQGETIYYIEHSKQDDVVLVVRPGTLELDDDSLEPVAIGTVTAYGKQTADYSILKFEKDGFLYTLTCYYEYQTLTEVAESILFN